MSLIKKKQSCCCVSFPPPPYGFIVGVQTDILEIRRYLVGSDIKYDVSIHLDISYDYSTQSENYLYNGIDATLPLSLTWSDNVIWHTVLLNFSSWLTGGVFSPCLVDSSYPGTFYISLPNVPNAAYYYNCTNPYLVYTGALSWSSYDSLCQGYGYSTGYSRFGCY